MQLRDYHRFLLPEQDDEPLAASDTRDRVTKAIRYEDARFRRVTCWNCGSR
jgi:hypothetical protein